MTMRDIVELVETGNTDKVADKALRISIDLMLVTGFIIRALAKAGAREATAAAANVVPFVGQAAFIIGSYASALLLIWDVAEILSDTVLYKALTSDQKRLFEDQWRLFQQPLSTDKIDFSEFGDERSLKQLFEANPFPKYDDRSQQGQFAMLVKDPLIRVRENFADADWHKLHWQAVIPMYTDGFPIDIIENVVALPETVAKEKSGIRTIRDIIDYYEEIKTDSPQSDDDEIKIEYLSGKKVTLSKAVVAELLREGKLLPNNNVEFYEKDRWKSFKP